MKVGDYVRYKRPFDIKETIMISKIIRIYEPDEKHKIKGYDLDTSDVMSDEFSIKSSPDIIDLIEVGDILVIKDFVDEACMIFTDIYLIQNEQQLLNIKNDLEKNKNKKLYSIVTKEQFESMEYRIGDD